ncbi:sensor histidine kinase [Novosphingobium bradum]|uniref:histidine kinase n=1 Tax=Novosphingobium bradum TaxID=1737444 RepID=A0ABV7IP99_9SPHN
MPGITQEPPSRWRDRLSRLILRQRSPARKLALTLAWLALATIVRWALDQGAMGVPFLTFYPVVLVSALLLGGRYAVLSAVASLLIARFLFSIDPLHMAETPVRVAMFLLYCLTVSIVVVVGAFVRQLLLESEAHIDQAEAFNAELQHRARNARQVLRALIGRRPAPGEDAATYHANLVGRLEAYGKASDLLRHGAIDSAGLGELVATATAPFDDGRIRRSGPDCRLHKATAMALVMALHELATNAVKYGALSAAAGTVAITWQVLGAGLIGLEWREDGGPSVIPPVKRGMGSRLLRPHGGLAEVAFDWNPAGLVCRMKLNGETAAASYTAT